MAGILSLGEQMLGESTNGIIDSSRMGVDNVQFNRKMKEKNLNNIASVPAEVFSLIYGGGMGEHSGASEASKDSGSSASIGDLMKSETSPTGVHSASPDAVKNYGASPDAYQAYTKSLFN